ncbi:T9SS type A sorting domain-containing protein, partial [candidate division WOR-3 bacterium]|nr:T9SS type A sorting domain-containing protein [candidate division WOR-3 bacterium]
PALGNVTLSWQLPYAQHVRVAVYDMLGRLVRTVQDGESPAGTGRAVWDRRDQRGRRVSAGIYFGELQAGGKAERRKLVLVR